MIYLEEIVAKTQNIVRSSRRRQVEVEKAVFRRLVASTRQRLEQMA